jgi:hypothetical protein
MRNDGSSPASLEIISPFSVKLVTSLHDLTGEFGPRTNLRAIEDQDPRNKRQKRSDATKEAACTAECQLVVHLCSDEWEYTACQVISLQVQFQMVMLQCSPNIFLQKLCAASAELAYR